MFARSLVKNLLAISITIVSFSALAGWDKADVIRKSKEDGRDRCTERLAGVDCAEANEWALDTRAITRDAFNWLEENGWYVTQAKKGVPGSLCKCGCFLASTAIYTQDDFGTFLFKKASDLKVGDQILRLDAESNLQSPSFVQTPIKHLTTGLETEALYVFHLDNGHKLGVTSFHGMLLFDGKMAAAKDVKSGNSFISSSGDPVRIMSITREKTSAPVINFDVGGSNHAEHIILAEDVLVGELAFQNQYASILKEIDLRN